MGTKWKSWADTGHSIHKWWASGSIHEKKRLGEYDNKATAEFVMKKLQYFEDFTEEERSMFTMGFNKFRSEMFENNDNERKRDFFKNI